MECDSVHSCIERAKKAVSVYIPEDWHNLIALARKKNPYTVIPLLYNDILDVKRYVSSENLNLKMLESGEKLVWSKNLEHNNKEGIKHYRDSLQFQ